MNYLRDLGFTAALAALLGTGCATEVATPPDAIPAPAPLSGKTDGTDRADRSCDIVLRTAQADEVYEGEPQCNFRGHCNFEVELDVSHAAMDAGAEPAILFRDQSGWWEAGTTRVDDVVSGYARFISTITVLDHERVRFIPFYHLDGGRIFDHNVVSGDLDNYLLSADNDWAIETSPDTCPGTGASATMRFEDGFSHSVEGDLRAGGSAVIEYDRGRFYDIIDGSVRYSGYFASRYHCYGYGCCEVEFPDIKAYYRFRDSGRFELATLGDDDQVTVSIPSDAESLELFFHVESFEIRTWYCGCDAECSRENYDRAGPRTESYRAWDSVYGRNYRFSL